MLSKKFLANNIFFYQNEKQWDKKGKLDVTYSQDGTERINLISLKNKNPHTASVILKAPLYSPHKI